MNHYITRLFIVGTFLVFGSAEIAAAGGSLDTGFNGSGKAIFNIESSIAPSSLADVAVIDGGKFLVAGRVVIRGGSYYAVALSRYNGDGSLDTSFGEGGKVITDTGLTSEGAAVAVQSDGKIVVTANAGNYPDKMTVVLRYSPDGILDTTFGNNGFFFSSVMRVAKDISILADDKIVVAGLSNVPNLGRTQVLKLTANGSLDTTFGTNGITTSTYSNGSDTSKMVVQSDGKIVVSGSNLFTVPKWLVHRFNTDGSPDSKFGTSGIREVNASGSMYPGGLGLQPDGKIVVGGFTSVPQVSDTQIAVARLNTDGSTDTSFGGGMVFFNLTSDYDRTHDVTIQSDGKILISGQRNQSEAMVMRLLSTGAIDTTFGTAGVAALTPGVSALAIALQGSNIVAVGPQGLTNPFLARLDQTGSPLTYGNESFVTGNNDVARDVAIQTDGKIVAAGVSETASRIGVVSVARLLADGSLDSGFGSGGRATVSDGTNYSEAFAVDIQPDGKIVVAGRGSQIGGFFAYYSLFVARFNADGSLDGTFGTGGKVIITNPSNLIGYDMELQPDGKIVVGGWIERVVGDGIFDHDMMAARLNPDGTRDSGFGNNGVAIYIHGTSSQTFFEQARALSIQPDGKIILAGTHLLRLDTNGAVDSTFSATPVPLSFSATDIKLQPDGKMVLSGSQNFDFALARYNSNATVDTSFGLNGISVLDFGGGTDIANSIYLDPNGDIVAGGSTVGGSSAHRNFALARFKPNGAPDPSFGTGGKVITDLGGDAGIFGVARQSDGKIVAAGDAKLGIDRDYALARYTSRATLFDFDGDAKTDISIFRPSVGEWWISKSSNNSAAAFQFGNSADKIVPADFTGDGKTDAAVFRPSTGEWFVLRSEDSSYYAFPFGLSGDIPAPGDFDNDGKADAAVFRPSTGVWYINKSSGGIIIQQFGAHGDVPVVADYDNDGISDIAIWRASAGQWWINRSTLGLLAFSFGNSADKPVQGDYTGDGKADAAFWRPSTGEWFVLRSEDFSYYAFPFGSTGDVPTIGDYDGDGKFDAAIFRPSTSTWYVLKSTAGISIQVFGQNGDSPVPAAFVP